MSADLLPCPHCGGAPKLEVSPGNSDGPGVARVKCTECNAQGGWPQGFALWRCKGPGKTEAQAIAEHDAEAIRLWNNRTGAPQ